MEQETLGLPFFSAPTLTTWNGGGRHGLVLRSSGSSPFSRLNSYPIEGWARLWMRQRPPYVIGLQLGGEKSFFLLGMVPGCPEAILGISRILLGSLEDE